MTEVRPLRIHDLPFAYRLAGHGVSFDSQISLTIGGDSLHQVVLTGTGRVQTYVLRQPDCGGLGQLHFLPGTQHVRLAYVAPSIDGGADEDLWLSLLDGLAVMAGQRGAVTIIAEVGEDTAEFGVLRQAGFAVYARQYLWRRLPAPVDMPFTRLRQADAAEYPALLGLYGMLVPGLIKHVEPPPTAADVCYVLDGPRGLAGMVLVYEGPHAAMVEPYRSPDCSCTARSFMGAALGAAQADKRLIYCRVREYMGCMESALGDAGFEYLATQVVMFRHTAVRVTHQTYRLKEKVEGGVPLPTSIVRE